MPHVVTQSCCSDASCVYVCPVNCIHPTPDEPDFGTAEMLYIDPESCVDCGACVPACPVDAIKPHTKLGAAEQDFLSINADFHAGVNDRPLLAPVVPPLRVRDRPRPPRVAVVGSGPAAMYAADEILTVPGARVTMFERLPAPHGLARYGVAPDHRRTRRIGAQFDDIVRHDGLTLRLGVDVGTDVTHAELLAEHHAVVYATGASADRRLDVPGADLPGASSATEFVAWYNGHPGYAERTFDLSHRRAVLIGNGNVALDVARILTVDPASLAGTDIAPSALEALRYSRIEEVVVAARRGPGQSAFTLPELIGLRETPGVDLAVPRAELDACADGGSTMDVLRGLAPSDGRGRRIRLRYLLSPARIVGTSRVEGVEFERNELVATASGETRGKLAGSTELLDAGLVLTSIGYRGLPVPGIPFDSSTATVPNDGGRVIDPATRQHVPGTYVAGWIKRGPSGFIGTNKACARESVLALIDDYNAGILADPVTMVVAG